MKLFKYIAGLAVVTAAVVAFNSNTASATNTACKIEAVIPVTIQDHGKNFTFNSNGTVTAQFKITGDANCKKNAVLASWIMKDATGQPLESQIFHDSAPKSPTLYGPGIHKLTVKVPQCDFWQLDLIESYDPKGFNGTANYGNLMHPIDNEGPLDPGHRRNLIDAKAGGQKKDCTPPPKDLCPNIDGTQTAIPAGHQLNGQGQCVVPPTPTPPVTPPQVQATTTELPKTGAGSVATAFVGISTLTGSLHWVIRRFRKTV